MPRRTISTRKRRRNVYFDIIQLTSILYLEEIGNYYRYNIIYIVKIIFRNLSSKNRSLLSLFPINWSLLHELNHVYLKFRIKLPSAHLHRTCLHGSSNLLDVFCDQAWLLDHWCDKFGIDQTPNSVLPRADTTKSRLYVYTCPYFFYHRLKIYDSISRFLKIFLSFKRRYFVFFVRYKLFPFIERKIIWIIQNYTSARSYVWSIIHIRVHFEKRFPSKIKIGR